MRRILAIAVASGLAGATLAPVPAAALTLQEVVWCVSALAENPRPGNCLAAIRSFKCANYGDAYGRDVQIGACTEAAESASWNAEGLAEIFINRGTAYQVTNDRDAALADYSQAIRLDPKAAVAFYDRGLIYADKGDIDRAMSDYNAAIRLDRKLASAFSDRGTAYEKKGDLGRAIADYDEAIRIGRAGDGAFDAFLAYYGRATAYRAKGDFDRAIADYSEALRLTSDTRAIVNRALTYLAKGESDRAIAELSQAMDDDPEDERMPLYRGIARLYSGPAPAALNDLNEAFEIGYADAYDALWLEIARRRAHLSSQLGAAVKRIYMKSWPAPIVRLYLGEIDTAAALAAADDADAATKAAHLCDANFFAGELALQRGAKDEAEPLLRRAASGCGVVVAFAANAALKEIGATPAAGPPGEAAGSLLHNDDFERDPIMKYPPPLPAAPPRASRPTKAISL